VPANTKPAEKPHQPAQAKPAEEKPHIPTHAKSAHKPEAAPEPAPAKPKGPMVWNFPPAVAVPKPGKNGPYQF
jgi:hypothetical protein